MLSVLELNAHARRILEASGGEVWVEGEVADLTRPASGHLYFMLGDGRAQVKCTMYRSDVAELTFELAPGQRVRVRGGLTIYEQRGTFQLQVREVLEAGEGSRAAEIARIKKKLAADGLLDPGRKRRLPAYPRTVGIVTSRDGAAFRDVVKVALDRFPARLVLVHALVQGPDAPAQIVRALEVVQRSFRTLDVVILARGGGASEDLAAFDDERVARAVAGCRVPIVTGVGHEIDVTLADLCADVRAATPSNAAELAVPSLDAIRRDITSKERALQRAFDQVLDGHRLRLERASRALSDPRRLLRSPRAALSSSERSLERAMQRTLAAERSALVRLTERLGRLEPRARLVRDGARLDALFARLGPAMERAVVSRGRARFDALTARIATATERLLAQRRARLEGLAARLGPAMERLMDARRHALGRQARALDALSPLAVLDRGYAIATIARSGRAVRDPDEAPVGTRLRLRVARGTLETEVVEAGSPEREIA